MGCEICGRGSCTRSFHSIEEQESFDSTADTVKDRIKLIISNKVNRLNGEEIDGIYYVKLTEVLDIIDDAN